jgi:hypothetical protein
MSRPLPAAGKSRNRIPTNRLCDETSAQRAAEEAALDKKREGKRKATESEQDALDKRETAGNVAGKRQATITQCVVPKKEDDEDRLYQLALEENARQRQNSTEECVKLEGQLDAVYSLYSKTWDVADAMKDHVPVWVLNMQKEINKYLEKEYDNLLEPWRQIPGQRSDLMTAMEELQRARAAHRAGRRGAGGSA